MSPSSFHFFPAENLIARPVAAFDENIGKQMRNHISWRELIENDHGIHRLQPRQNLRSFLFRNYRPRRPFQLAHARIAIQPDNQRIPHLSRQFKSANVPGMKQVKATIRENNLAPIAFLAAKPQNRLLKCQGFRMQGISM